MNTAHCMSEGLKCVQPPTPQPHRHHCYVFLARGAHTKECDSQTTCSGCTPQPACRHSQPYGTGQTDIQSTSTIVKGLIPCAGRCPRCAALL
jgi:hypothetical protein